MLFETKTKVNTNYASPLKRGKVLRLTKNYTTSPGGNEYMVEGCFCRIYKCDLDFLYVDKNGEEKELVGNGPWCIVDTIIDDSDCKTEKDLERLLEGCDFTGVVREEDLREVMPADLLARSKEL